MKALIVLVIVLIAHLLAFCFGGLAVGAANAWIMQGTFGDAWVAWWDRWYISAGWMILFMGGISAASNKN